MCFAGELSAPSALTDAKERVVVMGYGLVGVAYPVTRDTDYAAGASGSARSKLYGAALDQAYDTAFVRVDPRPGVWCQAAADPLPGGAEAEPAPPALTLQELVFKDEAQLLPRYLVYFTEAEPIIEPK
jgi:hypothetical protein